MIHITWATMKRHQSNGYLSWAAFVGVQKQVNFVWTQLRCLLFKTQGDKFYWKKRLLNLVWSTWRSSNKYLFILWSVVSDCCCHKSEYLMRKEEYPSFAFPAFVGVQWSTWKQHEQSEGSSIIWSCLCSCSVIVIHNWRKALLLSAHCGECWMRSRVKHQSNFYSFCGTLVVVQWQVWICYEGKDKALVGSSVMREWVPAKNSCIVWRVTRIQIMSATTFGWTPCTCVCVCVHVCVSVCVCVSVPVCVCCLLESTTQALWTHFYPTKHTRLRFCLPEPSETQGQTTFNKTTQTGCTHLNRLKQLRHAA